MKLNFYFCFSFIVDFTVDKQKKGNDIKQMTWAGIKPGSLRRPHKIQFLTYKPSTASNTSR